MQTRFGACANTQQEGRLRALLRRPVHCQVPGSFWCSLLLMPGLDAQGQLGLAGQVDDMPWQSDTFADKQHLDQHWPLL